MNSKGIVEATVMAVLKVHAYKEPSMTDSVGELLRLESKALLPYGQAKEAIEKALGIELKDNHFDNHVSVAKLCKKARKRVARERMKQIGWPAHGSLDQYPVSVFYAWELAFDLSMRLQEALKAGFIIRYERNTLLEVSIVPQLGSIKCSWATQSGANHYNTMFDADDEPSVEQIQQAFDKLKVYRPFLEWQTYKPPVGVVITD
jgi:hypothetical protein